jgi:hypothetical protein
VSAADAATAAFYTGRNCAQYDAWADNIAVMVELGSFTDYYRPMPGKTLCQLLATEVGGLFLHGGGDDGASSSSSAVAQRYAQVSNFKQHQATHAALLGGIHGPNDGTGREYAAYWGTRARANGILGGCGVASAGGAFACGQAITVKVQQLDDGGWTPYASWDGQMIVTADEYNNGYGAYGDDNYSAQCSLYDAYPGDGGQLVIRLTMGVYVDYLKPAGSTSDGSAQTMCTMLSSPGTWFWHSTISADGPFQSRNGNHQSLLGGWLYDAQGAAPADEGDDRTWGVFW